MRILCLSEGYLPDVIGGIEVFAAQLYGELARRGHEILVVTSRFNGEPEGVYEYEGIKLFKLAFEISLQPSKLREMAALQRRIYEIVADFRPDVIHENDVRPSSFFFSRRGPLSDTPRALTLHGASISAEPLSLHYRQATEADRIIAVSQYVAKAEADSVPETMGKIVCILNALKLPQLHPAPISFAPPVFLCMGRVADEKGMDVAIKALRTLQDESVRLEIVGSGPQRRQLEQLVIDNGLSARVSIRGWLLPSDIPAAISAATAVIVPSRWQEPFGLVALQAAQMGRPVIASRVGALPEIVSDGETGLLIPPDDPPALAAAMEQLLSDQIGAKRMGLAARECAETKFNFDAFVKQYEEAFQSAIDARSPLAGTIP